MSPEEVWKRMASVIAHQDNAYTADPIFVVQRHRRVYGFDPAYSDRVVYLTNDDYVEVDLSTAPRCPRCQHPYTVAQINNDAGIATCPGCSASLSNDECKKIMRDYEDALKCPKCEEPLSADEVECEHCDKCDSSFDLGDDLWLTKTAYRDSWENAQSFFTRQGAEDYLRINGHNLQGHEPPRIYVDSAFRNAEWQAVRALLMAGIGYDDLVGVKK